jgi:hypothetical protein
MAHRSVLSCTPKLYSADLQLDHSSRVDAIISLCTGTIRMYKAGSKYMVVLGTWQAAFYIRPHARGGALCSAAHLFHAGLVEVRVTNQDHALNTQQHLQRQQASALGSTIPHPLQIVQSATAHRLQACRTRQHGSQPSVQQAVSHGSTWNTEEVAGFQRSEASDELKVPRSDRHTFPSAYLLSHMRLLLVRQDSYRNSHVESG